MQKAMNGIQDSMVKILQVALLDVEVEAQLLGVGPSHHRVAQADNGQSNESYACYAAENNQYGMGVTPYSSASGGYGDAQADVQPSDNLMTLQIFLHSYLYYMEIHSVMCSNLTTQ